MQKSTAQFNSKTLDVLTTDSAPYLVKKGVTQELPPTNSRMEVIMFAFATQLLASLTTDMAGVLPDTFVVGGAPTDAEVQRFKTEAADALYGVAVIPGGIENTSRFIATRFKTIGADPVVGLIATLDPSTPKVTFSGTAPSGTIPYNVHVLYGQPIKRVIVQMLPSDSLAGLATKVGAALTTASQANSVVGAAVTVTGADYLKVNIGTSADRRREVKRVMQQFSVKLYAGSYPLRSLIAAAFDGEETSTGRLGDFSRPWLYPPDGAAARVRYSGASPWYNDSQINGLWMNTSTYAIEYGIYETLRFTQVESHTENITDQNSGGSRTVYSGG